MQASSSRYFSLPLVVMLAAIAGMPGCAPAGMREYYAGLYATAPSAAAEPPAAVPRAVAKDVGMFGNFEIGPGFGAQTASGFAGVVAGVTDGAANPDSLRFLGDVYEGQIGGLGTNIPYGYYYSRTTMDGKQYDIRTIGNCHGTDKGGDVGSKPSHKITVTAPVGVRFDFNRENFGSTIPWMLFGRDIRVCLTRYYSDETSFVLELLPGEYEIYTGNHEYGQERYTLTLTEQPNLISHHEITLQPGFGELKASGIMLDRFYRWSPMAQPHKLTVTAPMTVEFLAENNSGRKLNIALFGQDVDFIAMKAENDDMEIKRMVVPLRPGQYELFIELPVDIRGMSDSPGPYALTVQENTTFKPQHLTLGQGFSPVRIRGVWVKNNEDGKWDNGIPSAPHRLTVTTPQLVSIRVGTIGSGNKDVIRDSNHFDESYDARNARLTPLLRHISSPDGTVHGNSSYWGRYETANMSVFLAPGEYELYVQGENDYEGPILIPRLYDIFIEPQQ